MRHRIADATAVIPLESVCVGARITFVDRFVSGDVELHGFDCREQLLHDFAPEHIMKKALFVLLALFEARRRTTARGLGSHELPDLLVHAVLVEFGVDHRTHGADALLLLLGGRRRVVGSCGVYSGGGGAHVPGTWNESHLKEAPRGSWMDRGSFMKDVAIIGGGRFGSMSQFPIQKYTSAKLAEVPMKATAFHRQAASAASPTSTHQNRAMDKFASVATAALLARPSPPGKESRVRPAANTAPDPAAQQRSNEQLQRLEDRMAQMQLQMACTQQMIRELSALVHRQVKVRWLRT
ncbi:hypothetical protein PybrP1_005410 [[Pythium] brassicae (nom. inval.)]|nr:hypothetical protein PybrP1_005410 [[Pythium] brassicae (nom. inval.)]